MTTTAPAPTAASATPVAEPTEDDLGLMGATLDAVSADPQIAEAAEPLNLNENLRRRHLEGESASIVVNTRALLFEVRRTDGIQQREAEAAREAERRPPFVTLAPRAGRVAAVAAVVGAAVTGFAASVAAGIDVLLPLLTLAVGLAALPPLHLRSTLDRRRAAAATERSAFEAAEAARRAWLDAVAEEARRALSLLISETAEVDYGHELVVRDKRGLAEVSSRDFETPPGVLEELAGELGNMRGGSIGISGPRGAGKTTLIKWFAEGRYEAPEAATQLGLVVSAPVDYAAREFVLHLFAKLCRRLLGREGSTEAAQETAGRDPIRRALYRYAVPASAACTLLGAIVIMLRTLNLSVPTPYVVGGLLLAVGYAGFLLSLRRGTSDRLRERMASDPLMERGHLEQEADALLRRIRWQQSFSTGYSGALKLPIGLEGGLNRTYTLAEQQWTQPEIVEAMRDFVGKVVKQRRRVVIGIDEMDKIASAAEAHAFLNDIKAVFGIPGCFYLVSVSEQAMSSFERRGLPFRDVFDSAFDEVWQLEPLLFADTRVVLRKRVLGFTEPYLALCHCLSAGLPRDAIRVARSLVQLRDTWQAEPDAGGQVAGPQLGEVTRRLIGDELRRKLAGLEVAARSRSQEPEVSDFLVKLRSIPTDPSTGAELVAHANAEVFKVIPSAGAQVEDPTFEDRLALWRLEAELGGFLYYAATVLDLFGDDLTEARLKAAASAPSSGARCRLDELAAARHAFSSNVVLAWRKIDEFRTDQDGFNPFPLVRE